MHDRRRAQEPLLVVSARPGPARALSSLVTICRPSEENSAGQMRRRCSRGAASASLGSSSALHLVHDRGAGGLGTMHGAGGARSQDRRGRVQVVQQGAAGVSDLSRASRDTTRLLPHASRALVDETGRRERARRARAADAEQRSQTADRRGRRPGRRGRGPAAWRTVAPAGETPIVAPVRDQLADALAATDDGRSVLAVTLPDCEMLDGIARSLASLLPGPSALRAPLTQFTVWPTRQGYVDRSAGPRS
jgi:hypothetical protein